MAPVFLCFHSYLFPNEHIPTLDEMVELCLANDLTMFIDVKSNVKLVRWQLAKFPLILYFINKYV